ncbi:MAG TPA: SH3 domain-containing protein [Burkholderiales bacterium]
MLRRLVLLSLCAAAQLAGAAEFRSVAEPAVLYDAPSTAAKPLYVVSRQYPVEVIVNLEAWVKVRDHTGALAWIEKRALAERRTLLVTTPSAEVRVRPEDQAPLSFAAAQNVVLDLVAIAPGGWLRVRHADGTDGFVRMNQVWGN